MERAFVDFIERFKGAVPHHDQGIINGVCRERKLILPLKFNVMSNIYAFSTRMICRMYNLESYYSEEERSKALTRPAIIHFTPGIYGRPWQEGCKHPAKECYLQEYRKSPWADEPLAPSSLKRSVRLFALAYQCLPRGLFATAYRRLSWFLHRKA